jgi:anti-anti-sigma regulatory factor
VQWVHAQSSPSLQHQHQHQLALVPVSRSLSHTEACDIADRALDERRARTIILDLKHVADATTSAFARLVLLRRLLLRTGRDLRLVNLRDRAASVYHVNRLAGVLPCA